MDMLNKLKALLGIGEDDESKDLVLGFTLENAEEIIKNYCNIEDIPTELNNTLLRMAIDLYRNESLGEEELPLGSISSITEGDTTVSYKNSSSDFKDTVLKNYEKQLKRYRKLVW